MNILIAIIVDKSISSIYLCNYLGSFACACVRAHARAGHDGSCLPIMATASTWPCYCQRLPGYIMAINHQAGAHHQRPKFAHFPRPRISPTITQPTSCACATGRQAWPGAMLRGWRAGGQRYCDPLGGTCAVAARWCDHFLKKLFKAPTACRRLPQPRPVGR